MSESWDRAEFDSLEKKLKKYDIQHPRLVN